MGGEPESSESGVDQLNTAEKQKLKREMMMMGYDEDSYGDQEHDDGANGQYIVEDDDNSNGQAMTEEQLFQEQKRAYAAQLKRELMGGTTKK